MKTIYFLSALLSGCLLTGCKGNNNQNTGDKTVKVKVMQLSSSSVNESLQFSGTVEEENGTVLSFPVMGTLQSLHIHLGDHVTKGQLIATLDPTSMQSSYDAAKSSLEQAEDAYRRMKELHDKGSLPEIKWVEVQSQLKQAQSMEEIASKNLKDCKLYAPFNGYISEKSVEIGENMMPGMGVAKLVTTGLLKVKISVPETEIAHISNHQQAQIVVSALGGKSFSGTVIEKGVVANPLSRSYEVKIRVNDVEKELMPGMVADVYLEEEENTLCVIPTNIVQLDEHNNTFVWIAKDGKAEKRVITCGEFTSNGVQVLSGIKSGEQLIVEGQHKISSDMQVSF